MFPFGFRNIEIYVGKMMPGFLPLEVSHAV